MCGPSFVERGVLLNYRLPENSPEKYRKHSQNETDYRAGYKAYETELKDTDGLLLMENPLEESNTAPFEDNSQKLNTKSVTIKLKVQ